MIRGKNLSPILSGWTGYIEFVASLFGPRGRNIAALIGCRPRSWWWISMPFRWVIVSMIHVCRACSACLNGNSRIARRRFTNFLPRCAATLDAFPSYTRDIAREAISKSVYTHFHVLCKKGNRRGKRSLPVIQTRMKAATKKLENPRGVTAPLPINQRTRGRRKVRRNSRRWSTRMHNYLGSWRMSSKKVSNTVSASHSFPSVAGVFLSDLWE